MKLEDIKVGDMVRATSDFGEATKGKIGMVIKVMPYRVLVDFGKGFNGHNGNGLVSPPYPTKTYWVMPPSCLEPAPKIVISANGNNVIARLHEGGKVLKEATAKCSPDDTFDFAKGAEIAFDRLMGRETRSCIAPVEDEPVFVPHMERNREHHGNLGEPTNYKDIYGSPLRVGDTVTGYGEYTNWGESPIVHPSTTGMFVLGIIISCDEKSGTTGDWKIVLKRRFEDIKDGEKVVGITYIKKPRS